MTETPVTASATPTATLTGTRGNGAMSDPLRTTLALAGLVPAAIAVVTVPWPALLAVTALGVLVGLLTGTVAAFVRGSAARVEPIGTAAAVAVTEMGLVVAGVLVALGPASVVVLPALFLMVGTAWCADSPDRVRAMIGRPSGRKS